MLTANAENTIQWASGPEDASSFSMELINQAFSTSYVIANNVQSSLASISVELPVIPPG
jgi:hypothetical protein